MVHLQRQKLNALLAKQENVFVRQLQFLETLKDQFQFQLLLTNILYLLNLKHSKELTIVAKLKGDLPFVI